MISTILLTSLSPPVALETSIFSSTLDSSFQPIPLQGLKYFEAVSELNMVTPLLRTDMAKYTCVLGAVFVKI